MKTDLCEIAIVLDESGSMSDILNDTIGGYNTFIDTHKNMPGEAKLTLIKFDTKYEIVHNGANIQDVPHLNEKTYVPGSSTALLDAVGRTIDEIGRRLADTPEEERPGKVIFLVMTDGEENSSKEYTIEQVREKMKHQQDVYKWDVVFIGADQDAWGSASLMGIHNAVDFDKTDMKNVFMSAALYSANSRSYSKKTSLDNFELSEEELNDELGKYNKKGKA